MLPLSVRRLLVCASALVLGSVAATGAAPAAPSAANADATPPRVRDLLRQMTLEEKVGQLVQYSNREDMTGPAAKSSIAPLIEKGQVGSLLNIVGAAETRKWQKLAVESSRLHIPLIFGLDVIHGYRTVFPIPLASAASWDLKAIEAAERIAAIEASASGVHWTFAPMVDIARDPRWGRISEGSGEDPYLGSAIARARVRGFQGKDLAATDTILACAKHFAAYGAAQAGRDYFTTELSERTLRDVYLPPFKAAVDEGVGTFMAAFNDLDGTPCSANAFLMDRVLRREWGFRGFVVSDWASIEELKNHGSVTDLRDAARQSINAGLDMDMQSEAYGPYLVELVRAGLVTEARIDAAVTAILEAKFRLGLFDDPYRYSDENREKAALLRPEHLEATRDLARRSCVLLKNDGGTLPLAAGKDSDLTVALVGPLADSPFHQMGAWHARGQAGDSVTVREALAELFPGRRLRYARGCEVRGEDMRRFADALGAAKEADVIIAAMGEDEGQSGEATSRAHLELSGPQAKLLQELRALGKPIVLLLMTGRPLMIEKVEPLADAILLAWHPGTMGGPAIADVLTGAYNPSGKLPITWPRSVGQIPVFYAHKRSGRPAPRDAADRYYSHYIDSPNTPLYPFGYGLSYTTIAHDQLRLSDTKIKVGGAPLTVTIRVRNLGDRTGEDVVQLYVRDRVGSVTRPVRELKGFAKLELKPGESRDVTFQLTTEDLSFWRADLTFGPEPGVFDVFVGGDSNAGITASFTLES